MNKLKGLAPWDSCVYARSVDSQVCLHSLQPLHNPRLPMYGIDLRSTLSLTLLRCLWCPAPMCSWELCSKAIFGKFGVIKNSQKGQFLCTRFSHFEHIVAKCGIFKIAFVANLVCSAPYRKLQLIYLPILATVIIFTSDDLVTLSQSCQN